VDRVYMVKSCYFQKTQHGEENYALSLWATKELALAAKEYIKKTRNDIHCVHISEHIIGDSLPKHWE